MGRDKLRIGSISFIVISALLVVAIYSSSMSVVFAKPPLNGSVKTCNQTFWGPGLVKTETCCTQYYADGKEDGKAVCTKTCKDVMGNEYTCPKRTAEEDMVDPGLLGNGTLKGESQNTTKVPKSGLLNEGGVLKGEDGNQSTSKTIVGPNDRFCVEGTGGDTGTPCLPCDPGLKFEVGCIDVTTGGPLDMPDAATSESEEEDDTNPKDLDGSNNDENGPAVNPGSD